MRRKRYCAEQIIGILRKTEIDLGQRVKIGEMFRALGIAEQTFCR